MRLSRIQMAMAIRHAESREFLRANAKAYK